MAGKDKQTKKLAKKDIEKLEATSAIAADGTSIACDVNVTNVNATNDNVNNQVDNTPVNNDNDNNNNNHNNNTNVTGSEVGTKSEWL